MHLDGLTAPERTPAEGTDSFHGTSFHVQQGLTEHSRGSLPRVLAPWWGRATPDGRLQSETCLHHPQPPRATSAWNINLCTPTSPPTRPSARSTTYYNIWSNPPWSPRRVAQVRELLASQKTCVVQRNPTDFKNLLL